MTAYTATIRHHSISRARVVNVGNKLLTAKRNATREFGDDYVGHTIVIHTSDQHDPTGPVIAAERRIGNRHWKTYI